MSIQALSKKTLYNKLQDLVLISCQIFTRFFSYSSPKVFFRYRTKSIHPAFKRFYDNPPVDWSNPIQSNLAHWINYPAWIDAKPFIIEVNDHPLSAVSYKNRRMSEPGEILRHLNDAYEVYASNQCKKILLPCDGFENLFKYYFQDTLTKKFHRVPSPGCVPKVNHINASLDYLGFACLASDYSLKGVDLVLTAWQSIDDKRGAKLYLACPNIPETVWATVLNDSSIIVINQAPLNDEQKNRILNSCAVTISPTHVHAGANIIEGMEHGHAIIHFDMHTTAHNHLGYRVNMPYHFYEIEMYAKKWITKEQFVAQLMSDKKMGLFTASVNQLSAYIRRLINDSNELNRQRNLSLASAYNQQSLNYRNNCLVNLYQDIIYK